MTSVTEIPPHAPQTGWARRVLGDFHVTGLFWYRLHAWAARALPEPLLAPAVSYTHLTLPTN